MHKALIGLAALAAAALAIEIPETPTWQSGRCTDKSLTIPSWIISRYKVEDGTTSYRVVNRAADPTGLIADVTCTPDGSCQTTGIDEIHATISQTSEGTVLSLQEIWVCGDSGDKVFFNSRGNITITDCAGDDCVSPITHLVYGSLSLPVPLTPAQPSPPAGYVAPSCASVGNDQWTITDVSYDNYAKGQCKHWYWEDRICLDNNDFIAKGDHVKLTVTNNAIEHEVSCSFTPTYEDTDIPDTLRCTGGHFNEIILDVAFSGVAPDFTLEVEQLWYCLENAATNTKPTVVVANGTTSIELACATSTGITGAPDDIVIKCTDGGDSHTIDGTEKEKKALPDFSLVTAPPSQGGCTYDSVVNPTWYMRGLFFETTEFPANDRNSAKLERFTCGLTGPGFADYFFYDGDTISGSGVNSVYNCNVYYDGRPEHFLCSYGFNPFNKILTLDKVWKCNDKDAANPLYFGGQGTFDWKKDPYYRCDQSDTHLQCSWYDSLALLQPGIPYDIPYVTVSLENAAPPQAGQANLASASSPRVEAYRVDGKWFEGEGPSDSDE